MEALRSRHLRPNPSKPPCRNEGFLKEKTNQPTNWKPHHFGRKTGTFAFALQSPAPPM